MNSQIYVNFVVKDLPASKDFYAKLGYTFKPEFTGEHSACLVISEHIYCMLMTPATWTRFTPKAVCDTSKSAEVLLALSCESRDEVNELVKNAVAAGGKTTQEPEELGFMYSHGFEDLDGHAWGPFYMDPSQPMPKP